MQLNSKAGSFWASNLFKDMWEFKCFYTVEQVAFRLVIYTNICGNLSVFTHQKQVAFRLVLFYRTAQQIFQSSF